MFYLKDFYTSSSKKHLTDFLPFTETIIKLKDHDKNTPVNCYFSMKNVDEKKGDLFDVTMDAYDDPLVCELILIFY